MLKIIASKQYETERYIRSTKPVLYVSMRRDGATFISDDAFGHLATVTGALWIPQGRNFTAASNHKISIPHNAVFNVGANATFETWFKCTSSANFRIFLSKESTGDGNKDPFHFRVNQTTGVLFGRSGNTVTNTSVTGTTDVVDSRWHHGVFTISPTLLALYLDGISHKTTSFTLTPNTTTDPIFIGLNGDGTLGQQGLIGEVRIYSRVLISLEIQRNYLMTKFRYQ